MQVRVGRFSPLFCATSGALRFRLPELTRVSLRASTSGAGCCLPVVCTRRDLPVDCLLAGALRLRFAELARVSLRASAPGARCCLPLVCARRGLPFDFLLAGASRVCVATAVLDACGVLLFACCWRMSSPRKSKEGIKGLLGVLVTDGIVRTTATAAPSLPPSSFAIAPEAWREPASEGPGDAPMVLAPEAWRELWTDDFSSAALRKAARLARRIAPFCKCSKARKAACCTSPPRPAEHAGAFCRDAELPLLSCAMPCDGACMGLGGPPLFACCGTAARGSPAVLLPDRACMALGGPSLFACCGTAARGSPAVLLPDGRVLTVSPYDGACMGLGGPPLFACCGAVAHGSPDVLLPDGRVLTVSPYDGACMALGGLPLFACCGAVAGFCATFTEACFRVWLASFARLARAHLPGLDACRGATAT